MAENYQFLIVFILTLTLSIAAYSVIFMFLLGVKFIRKHIPFDDESLVVTQIWIISATITITLEAIVLIFFDRQLSGKFLFIAAIAGLPSLVSGIFVGAGGEVKKAFEKAMEMGKYNDKGLLLGNLVVILSNICCFFLAVPSFL